MKTKKTPQAPRVRVHIPADDRARTNAGKTANSKVRSEGRHLAALERSSETKQEYLAHLTKEGG